MKNKIAITLILGMFLLLIGMSGVDAQQKTLGTFEKGECVELKQTCASCSYVNFSQVTYPDGTEALGNVQADKDGGVFNYTFCNTNQTGNYNVYGIGDVESEDTVFAYDFEVTTDGKPFQDFPIEFAFILLSLGLIGISYTHSRLNIFKYLGSFLAMVMGVITLYPGYNFINYETLVGQALGFILIGLGFYFLIEDSLSRDEQAPSYDQYHNSYGSQQVNYNEEDLFEE